MKSRPETSEEQKKFINPYKPLIYILPKDSSDLNQIVSNTIKDVKNDYQNIVNNVVKISAASEEDTGAGAASVAASVAVGVVSGVGSVLIPVLPAAVTATAVTGIAVILSNIFKNKNDLLNKEKDNNELTVSQNEIEQVLEKIDLSDWIDFVEKIPFASIPEELDFPPGHPLPSRFYRVHPLKKKNNKYIPIEIFDSILYKERESELIKILVDLGATEISVQKLSSSKIQGSPEAKASLIGAGGVSGETKGENEESSSADQVIKLNQKNWNSDNFKSDQYSWLPYEPDWEYIVHARLKGGCLSSSIELTSDTSFSISAQLALTEGLLENLGSLGVGGEFSRLRKEKKRFEVKFVDV